MIELKNPFIFAPIKLGYSDGDGGVNNRHIAFYTARSCYLGAVTIEPLYMDKGLREIPTQLGIDNDKKIKGLQKLVASIHKSGAKVIAHLNHPGRMANPKIPRNYFVSSTDKPCENGGAIPKRMNREDIDKAINLFIAAAARAQKANFDIIELQFGHGYLLAQFISPFVNDRKDEYGGDFENRIRFPLEVLQAVRKSIDLPIIVRISGDEMLSNGIRLPEMITFSRILEKNGVAAIHVSAGTVCSTPPWFFQHMFIPKGKTWEMAKEIRENIDLPVIFVGRINTVEDIKKVREKYLADYIAIGRGLVADPDFVGKYFGEEKEPIKPCLACVEGCLGGVRSGQGLQCLVNPEVGRETEVFKIAKRPKQYAVVGGGLAGMEGAITLKRRGHSVDLYEKDKLGGQFNLAPLTPNKKSMARLIPYFVEELKNKGVNIIFKKAAKSDIISQYDGVILATGSRPSVPPISGLDKCYWADILLEENLPENKRILIIGGGLIGVDIATALIPRDNKIIIVKRTTDFGEDMEMIAKALSLKMMNEKGTVFSDHTHIKKIEGKTVFAERNGEDIQFEDIDIIVVSTGMESYNPLERDLKNKIPVYVVGDARQIGNAQDAIRDAYETAKNL
ncbi:oxidoreductase [candidate division WOR-3 bacterium JGI_Cruoil_03_44_89]|uniref:Oxidoreductase n=1 Tax=candidate division WOR-3 bacterium JGI_Cruoil_03_44_89 TaxID=1973748 RepID=A0A235BRU0_UNCW3|nr:MAG: oxidoreductase [candidate division WOR-3 bacterium JGI_Cruoil_03_44_89]